MDRTESFTLLLDEADAPIIVQDECEELQPILHDFVETYAAHSEETVESWLAPKLQSYLPERSPADIAEIVSDIVRSLQTAEAKKASLEQALEKGRDEERWFADEIMTATSSMAPQQTVQYMNSLGAAVDQANAALYRTITTQTGAISQNPCLDGFIAEQYHAQTFNLNAQATGSSYRAEVLEPKPGQTYGKNSVDIVIKDGNGAVRRRYQSKYCKDAAATERAFENGDYRGQRKLVPEGQEGEISKNCSIRLEAPDGTTSNPLSKERAMQMRDEAQSGQWNELNWNEYKAKDLAIGIGKQAGKAALQGAAIGVGFDIARKIYNGEKITGQEIVETALKSGTDFGVKAAAAGALKVGSEKGIISAIPKGTPASTIANIAFVAVENIKIVGKMMKGELHFSEGMEKIRQTTVSAVAGLATMGKGAALGAAIGTALGPVGTAIGGFIGGTVGYMAGSKVGEAVYQGFKKVREDVRAKARKAFEAGKSLFGKIVNAVFA